MRMKILGGTESIALSATAKSGYIITEYELGVPDLEESETGPASFSTAIRREATDSITLSITGNNREAVRAQTERLHLVLRQAMDYWAGSYKYPVFFSVMLHDATKPMYAAIKSFEFHELPDPSDLVNKAQKDVTLVVTRRMWSSVPPQPVPHLFVDENNGIMTESQIGEFHLRPRLLPISKGKLHHDRDLTVITPDDSNDSMVFLANGYRFGAISNIIQPGLTQNHQPTAYTTPYTIAWGNTSPNILIGNQGDFATAILGLALNIGTVALGVKGVDVYNGRNGGTFHKLFGPDLLRHNTNAGYGGAAYTATSPRTMYGNTQLQTKWNYPPANSTKSEGGYWVQLSASGLVTQLPTQTNNLLYCPWSPYIDVSAKGGSLDMPLRLAIKFLSRWNEDPGDASQYVANRRFATDVVIASSHSNVDKNDMELYEPGFYNFRSLNELTEDNPHFYSLVNGVIGKPEENQEAPGGHAYRFDLSDLYSKSYSPQHRVGGFFVNLASIVYRGWQNGMYRIFLRYKTTATTEFTALPTYSFRLAVGPYQSQSTYLTRANYSRIHTHIHGVEGTYSSKYLDSLINVADFGAIRIPSNPGVGQHNQVVVQGATNYTGWSTGSADVVDLFDLIVLPINENFMHFTGSQTGKAPFTTNGGDIWEKNAETLHIDGWSPKGTTAYLADEIEAATGNSYGKGEGSLAGSANNPWTRLTTGEAMIKPYGRTRLYFFYFKRASNGVLLSDPGLVTSVKAWAMDQRMTVPSLPPEVKYVERPPMEETDPGDDFNLPVADIIVSDTDVTTAETVTFTDNSTINGGISRVVWHIEGLQIVGGIGGDVEHVFSEEGLHKVILAVYGRNGLIASTDVVAITVTKATPPRPNFTFSPLDPDEDELITFSDLSQNVTGVTKWIWNFGDGTVTTKTDATDITHTYTDPGRYIASLELTNDSGSIYAKIVGVVPVASLEITPTADFSWTPTSPVAQSYVTFSDTSTSVTDVLNWHWDFGDGVTYDGPVYVQPEDVTHAYQFPGTYNVTLRLDGNAGVVLDEVTKQITVVDSETVNPGFSWSPASPTAGQDITVSDTSTGVAQVTQWIWEVYYANEIQSQVLNTSDDIILNFAAAGDYDVILYLYGPGGFIASASDTITVS